MGIMDKLTSAEDSAKERVLGAEQGVKQGLRDRRVQAIIALALLLLLSVGLNVWLIRGAHVSAQELEGKRQHERELLGQNARLDSLNRAIQAEKDVRTARIDSLQKIIDRYETQKNNRGRGTQQTVDSVKRLSARQSLDDFLQWTK
jgi:hypothetical protein